MRGLALWVLSLSKCSGAICEVKTTRVTETCLLSPLHTPANNICGRCVKIQTVTFYMLKDLYIPTITLFFTVKNSTVYQINKLIIHHSLAESYRDVYICGYCFAKSDNDTNTESVKSFRVLSGVTHSSGAAHCIKHSFD